MRFRGAIAPLLLLAAGAQAQVFDFSGDLSVQGRRYPESPAFPGQRSTASGIVVEPTLYAESSQGNSFTFTPFYRYDSADSQRTHADVREAYFLTYGDWSETAWELRLGVDRVFWGVAELNGLVDIVNQWDLVEHPRDRPKLGQPMAHLTISGDWGIAEAFVLPYHRERTFPGPAGRLRSGFLIEDDALYESSDEERHVDYAVRYSNFVGVLDFGLSAFVGTSREPSFLASHQSEAVPSSAPSLVPYYEQMRQFGVDAQITTESWLYKMEAIYRSGVSNLLGQEEAYRASILGLERSFYGLFDSTKDLTMLAEWHHDGRGRRAPTVWDNDVFIAGFLAFNDVQGTELIAGVLGDLEHDYRALNLDFKRRLAGDWSMRLESIVVLSSDPEDLTWDGRRDSFLGVDFTYSF